VSATSLKRLVFERNPVAWFETCGRLKSVKRGVGAEIELGKPKVARDPNKPPSANEMQREVGEAIAWCLDNEVPVRLIEYKPRQKGCSTVNTACGYVASRCRTMTGLVIGGQVSQTNNLWKMLRHYAAKDSFEWGNSWKDDTMKATCSNGSEWERETAGDKEAGRSGTYHYVIATEVARWRNEGAVNAGDVLNSILNCVPDEPETFVIMESTACGPVGVFPETWAGAVTLEQMKAGIRGNGYIKIFAPWYAFHDSRRALPPGKDDGWLKAMLQKVHDKKALQVWETHKLCAEQVYWYHHKLKAPECGGDPMKRDREYPTTPEDGFQASSPSRFALEALQQIDDYAKTRENDIQWGSLELAQDQRVLPCERRNYRRVSFIPGESVGAEVAILEHPRPECAYLIAGDNMKGRSYVAGDDPDCNAVGVIRLGYFDRQGRWHPPEVVASLVPDGWGVPDIKSPGNRWDMDQLAELAARLSGYYGNCMIAWESNRGEFVISELRKRGCLLWKRERPKDEVDSHEDSGLIGFETTPAMKKALIENLASAIRELNEPGAGFRCAFPWINREFRTFVRHKDGSEGALKITNCHDDFVIMTALLWMCKAAATVFVPVSMAGELPWDLQEHRERKEVW
jgi:hypothetical protein